MEEPKSRREQILDAAEKDRRRRRREGVIIAVAGLILAALLLGVFFFSRTAYHSSLLQPLILYFFNVAIWALILILILVLVFLTVRNVVKYVVERRRYRLRFRLVAGFVLLTVFPAVVLFFVSIYIVRTSIERLYSPHINNVVSRAKEVIAANLQISEAARQILEGKYEADGTEAVHFAKELARGIQERGLLSAAGGEGGGPGEGRPEVAEEGSAPSGEDAPDDAENLVHYLELKRQEYNLALAAVFDGKGRIVARSAAGGIEFPEIPLSAVEETLAGSQGFNPPEVVGSGAVIYGFYPLPRHPTLSADTEVEIVGGVVAGRYISWVPAREWHKLSAADEARAQIEEFELLSRLERPMRGLYYLLLLCVTLIVLFLAAWFGFYLAKGLSEPIQLLAEGTEMVASGRLDYKIDLAATGDDEISVLVRSFNKMIDDLSRSRRRLDEAYENLRQTNLELEQRRRYMETVLARITAGVISVDAEDRISTVNPAALRMLGQTEPEKVRGRELAEFLQPEETEVYRTLAAEVEETQAPFAFRQFSVFRQDRRFVVLISVAPLRDEEGGTIGRVIMVEDMTELVRAHRAMAWREVARRIAHEIKNPLTPIQLAAQRLGRRYAGRLEGEEAEVFRQSIRTIITQVEQLKHLVNEFSLFARLPAANPRSSDLHQLLTEVLTLYRDAHPRIRFELRLDPALPRVELDPEQIKRALLNLLDNAAASIEGPGEVILETRFDEEAQMMHLEIRDSGHGIPDQVKDRIFEPDYSTKPQGTGLGLTIVQRIIADHNGYIRVLDNQPRGTTVVIELPVARREFLPGPREAAPPLSGGATPARS